MEIRSATPSDIPAIVDLLKTSLGEGLMPKSELFWHWKHVGNPFGISPVLLAFEGDEIIGVRAFMRWEWRWQDTIYKAVRAVDTATHPSHQGKGIFTKLSRVLVAQCKQEGTHFIFNTPNAQSRPGYLKMGWRDAGRMRLSIGLHVASRVPPSDFEPKYDLGLYLDDPRLTLLVEDDRRLHSPKMTTNRSVAYLKWRYLTNPNIRYLATGSYSGSSSFVLICRIKTSKYVRELRVCEVLSGAEAREKDIRDSLRAMVRDVRPWLVTSSGDGGILPGISLSTRLGPRITLMDLNGDVSQRVGENFKYWRLAIGDMEVF